MKRFVVFLLCAVMCLSLAACSKKSLMNENAKNETSASERDGFDGVTAPPVENITDAVTTENGTEAKKSAAIEAVKKTLGEKNPETGLKYVFSYDGTEISDGKEYVKIRVSTRTEDGVNTLFGYYLADGNGEVSEYGEE